MDQWQNIVLNANLSKFTKNIKTEKYSASLHCGLNKGHANSGFTFKQLWIIFDLFIRHPRDRVSERHIPIEWTVDRLIWLYTFRAISRCIWDLRTTLRTWVTLGELCWAGLETCEMGVLCVHIPYPYGVASELSDTWLGFRVHIRFNTAAVGFPERPTVPEANRKTER